MTTKHRNHLFSGLMIAALGVLAVPTLMADSATEAATEKLRELLESSPTMERLSIGLHVLDLDSGEVLFEKRANKLMTPASNMKLYSSAAALDVLGADFRWETRLYASGPVNDGTVEGDLIITGTGDPVFRSEELAVMISEWVSENGIQRINGDIVVHANAFQFGPKGPGWAWDDDPSAYNMSVDGLTMDYNVLTVEILPGSEVGGPARVAFSNPSDHPTIVNNTRTVAAETEDTRTRVTREPFIDVIEVSGTIPADASSRTSRLTMHDPASWIGGVAAQFLEDEGVTVSGDVLVNREGSAPEVGGGSVSTHQSPPLAEVLPPFNKPSENIIGEVLLLTLAAQTGNRPGYTQGNRHLTTWLTETVGLPGGSFRVADGSGLSRYNQITAEGTNALLAHMWTHPRRDVYVASLPIAGVDGTLRNRMTDEATRGKVLAKTGTMSSVSCLSGYVRTANGRTLAFSLLTNGWVGSSIPSRNFQDEICAILVEF
ncbi:MAG: D-alanyl-D-alanine carboxypeptidase/D-alanyl-D-alanine-endopeptidase [Candidatus Sumerlaeia bacterium]|nr:D-alanyl-D-alanine carboxypeptidase/D-alanyl-D-alanine-endopeptidase [Candidatus Sumerlaeia bacterium]